MASIFRSRLTVSSPITVRVARWLLGLTPDLAALPSVTGLTWRDVLERHDHSLLAVRHGQTPWNVENRVTTTTDIELTGVGLRQAEEAGAALGGVRIDRVLSSPLKRAVATAERLIASADFDGEIELDDRLREPAAGPFEGRIFPELWGGEDELAEEFAAFMRETDPVIPAGAEDPRETAAEVAGLLDELGREKGHFLISTHGGLVRVLACRFIGMEPRLAGRLKVDNCHALALKWYDEPPHQALAVNLPPSI